MNDLFPRAPRRMKQPTKVALRTQLSIAADEIEFWITEYQRLWETTNGGWPRSWWRRLFARPAKFNPRKSA